MEAVAFVDSKPGLYYVSVVNGVGDYRLLAGPFVNDHAAALGWVDRARCEAEKIDPKAVWYSFGTVRLEAAASPRLGILNERLGLPKAGVDKSAVE